MHHRFFVMRWWWCCCCSSSQHHPSMWHRHRHGHLYISTKPPLPLKSPRHSRRPSCARRHAISPAPFLVLVAMAVQARYGGGVPAARFALGGAAAEEQMRAAFLSAAAANDGAAYNCAAVASGAQSELTCNYGAGGALALRKRDRDVEQYVSSSSALLPIPGMAKVLPPSPNVAALSAATRVVESAAVTSTSGRPSAAASSFAADALLSELYQHNAEIDATVRMECERMRAGLEQARKRQCHSLVRAAFSAAARRLREKEIELEAARRRSVELEERLRQASAETQAWCGLARSNEAIAAGLRATLDQLLRTAPAPAPVPAEGFGESDFTSTAAGDAQSCCFEANGAPKDHAAKSPAGKWACKSCVEGEATVLLLPCRHLCLCKACEPKLDACPVCLAAKNASIHIAMN